MTQDTIMSAIMALRPRAEWTLRGDDLSSLEWLDKVQARPTDDELVAEMEREASAPAPAPALSYLRFRALFTADENTAIMTAARNSGAILDWLLQAAGAGLIDMGNPQVKAGLDALAAAGLITDDRAAVILSGAVPQVSK